MENRAARIIAWIAVIVAAWVSVGNGVQVIRGLGRSRAKSGIDRDQHLLSGSDAEIDEALRLEAKSHQVKFTGTAENPFRVVGEAVTFRRAGTATAAYSRVTLSLKGVLLKSKPLAILEDSQGATHISGVGDKVHGQEVLSISRDRVRLRDTQGNYELSVKER